MRETFLVKGSGDPAFVVRGVPDGLSFSRSITIVEELTVLSPLGEHRYLRVVRMAVKKLLTFQSRPSFGTRNVTGSLLYRTDGKQPLEYTLFLS